MSTREYTFALDKGLNADADEIRAAWNSDTECANAAVADVELTRGGVETVALLILGNIASGVAGDMLYDLLRRVFAARGKRVSMHEQQSATGEVVVVISEDKQLTA